MSDQATILGAQPTIEPAQRRPGPQRPLARYAETVPSREPRAGARWRSGRPRRKPSTPALQAVWQVAQIAIVYVLAVFGLLAATLLAGP